jgi:hypothetical protein
MSVSLDRFTDEELLALCRLADEVYEQFDLGKVLTEPEAKLLTILVDKGLWMPPENSEE